MTRRIGTASAADSSTSDDAYRAAEIHDGTLDRDSDRIACGRR